MPNDKTIKFGLDMGIDILFVDIAHNKTSQVKAEPSGDGFKLTEINTTEIHNDNRSINQD